MRRGRRLRLTANGELSTESVEAFTSRIFSGCECWMSAVPSVRRRDNDVRRQALADVITILDELGATYYEDPGDGEVVETKASDAVRLLAMVDDAEGDTVMTATSRETAR